MLGRYVVFGKSTDRFLKNEAARLEITVPELLRRIVDVYRGEIKPVSIDVERYVNKYPTVDLNTEMAQVFIITLKQGLASGKIHLKQDNAPGDGVCIGWQDDEDGINLYALTTLEELRVLNPVLKQASHNAIYRQLVAGNLVISGGSTTTKVKRSPEGKSARVLTLKPEALNIGH